MELKLYSRPQLVCRFLGCSLLCEAVHSQKNICTLFIWQVISSLCRHLDNLIFLPCFRLFLAVHIEMQHQRFQILKFVFRRLKTLSKWVYTFYPCGVDVH